MEQMLNDQNLTALRLFLQNIDKNPGLLNHPKLSFFKTWLEEKGMRIPAPAPTPAPAHTPTPAAAPEATPSSAPPKKQLAADDPENSDMEPVESDSEAHVAPMEVVDEVDPSVMAPETDEPLPMGAEASGDAELSESVQEQLAALKAQAAETDSLQQKVELLTRAILLAPPTPLILANRADALLKLRKPAAALRDTEAALKMNPDSAKSLKIRGKALRLLGRWEEAATVLRAGQKIDFDDDTEEVKRYVEEKFGKIESKRRQEEIRKRNQNDRRRQRRVRNAMRANRKAAREAKAEAKSGGMGMGPGGMGPNFEDPEMMAALNDAEVMRALQDIMQNHDNIAKYQDNPKIMKVLGKLMGSFAPGEGDSDGHAHGRHAGGFHH